MFILVTSGYLFGQTDSTVYTIPMLDKRPMWIGCESDSCTENMIFNFIKSNLTYPNHHDYEGKVYVQFIVEINGSTSNIIIRKGLEKDLDNEVVRLISIMPDFIPGRLNGKPVRCRFIIPVNFSLY